MQGEILAHQEESSLPEVLHEGRCEEVVKNVFGSRESAGERMQWELLSQKG